MAKRVRGETQTSTYGNSAYTGLALAMANDVRDGHATGVGGIQVEFYKQLQGQVMTGNPNLSLSQISEPQFQENMDLTQLYEGRSFELLNEQVSELIYNNGNEFFITVAAPLFVTNELSFHNKKKEWNQIDWTRVSETGLGERTTFSEWTWSDTLERRKMEAEMTLESVMDANFGAAVWDENLGVLAGTGLLTLMKEAAYGTYTIGYSNEIEDRVSKIALDLTKLFRWEYETFHCAAKGIDEFLYQCQRAMSKLPDQSNVIMIVPNGTSMRMRHVAGTMAPVQGLVITLNPQTQVYEERIFAGPEPVMSIKLGSTTVAVYEAPGFRVNSRDDTIEDPSICRITQCQVFPCDDRIKLTDPPRLCDRDANDMEVFYQDQETGEYKVVPYAEALTNCWGFDPETMEPSVYLDVLREEKNNETEHTRKVPAQFDVQTYGSRATNDINEESPMFDYDHPNAMAIGQETDLNLMTSWRHHCALLTYDTRSGQWRIPLLLGDYQLSNMPNAAFLRAARQLVMAHNAPAGAVPMQDLVIELKQIVDEINAEPWTVEYVKAILDTNTPFLEDGATKWAVNKHGAMRLPTGTNGGLDNMKWPPGYGFGGGLDTIEEEGNTPTSPFYKGAQRIANWKRHGGARLMSYMAQALGKSDVLDPANADDIHGGNATALDGLITALVGRPRYVMAGVPKQGSYGEGPSNEVVVVEGEGDARVVMGAGDTPTQRFVNQVKAATTIDDVTFDNVRLPPNPILRALCSLNAGGFFAAKDLLVSYFDAVVDADRQQLVDALAQNILQAVPFEGTDTVFVGHVSALAAETASLVTTSGVKDAMALLNFVRTKRNSDTKAKEWNAKTSQYNAIYTDNAQPLKKPLSDSEKRAYTPPKKDVVEDGRGYTRTPKTSAALRRDTAPPVDDNVNYFTGDYSLPPDDYLLAPLVATDSLDTFVTQKKFYWIVPASPQLKPVVTREDFSARNAELKKKLLALKGLHRLAGVYSLACVKCDNAAERRRRQQQKQQQEADDNDMDVETYDSRMGSRGGLKLNANPVSGSNIARNNRTRKQPQQPSAVAPVTVEDMYFGPWKNRLAFANTIEDIAVQLVFLALIQSRNSLDTLLRINDAAGAKVINVIMFRPFIESTAKSTVVMMGGGKALLTAMSRLKCLVSKEDRGVVHVGASMYTATIRRDPRGVRLVPLSHPNSFIGGKQVNFVTHPEQWNLQSELRPSIVALPTAITETIYKYPIDMMNEETFIRPGVDNDIYFRKYSAAELYRVVFSARRVDSVRTTHQKRLRYWDYVEISHVGYLGPRRFKDAATGVIRPHKGNGPGNDDNQNDEGAELVWAGSPNNYPMAIPLIDHRMRL
jgi:hypothetical protein